MITVSDVWKHFIKDQKFAICKHCVPQKQLSYEGTTFNLREHLLRIHPAKYSSKLDNEQSKIVAFKAKPPKESMELLYAFIIRVLHPFSVIRGGGFKKLVESLSPGFTIPSRTAITNFMETKFEEKKRIQLLNCFKLSNIFLLLRIFGRLWPMIHS